MSMVVSYSNLAVAPQPLPIKTLVGDGMLDASATFTRLTGNASYFDATPTMQYADANVPRWDHDPLTGAPLGLLIEQQSTNFCIPSAASDGWTTVNVTASTQSGGPLGSFGEFTLPAGDGTSLSRQIRPALAIPPSTAVTLSLLFTSSSPTFHFIDLASFVGSGVGGQQASYQIDLANRSVVNRAPSSIPPTERFDPLADGWYRFVSDQLRSSDAGASWVAIYPGRIAQWGSSGIGDDSYQSYCAMQVESAPVATSLIPTNGAAATRAKDTLTFPAPGATGTIIIDHDAASGASLVNTNSTDVLTSQGAGKIAIAWDASGTSVCYNGGAVTTGAAIAWGSDYELLKNANAHIKPNGATKYLTKLSDAELQAATT